MSSKGQADQQRPGVDLLLTTQVAEQEEVHATTVLRWIKKGLPAREASKQQVGTLVAQGYLENIPPGGKVYLIRKQDLHLISSIRQAKKHYS